MKKYIAIATLLAAGSAFANASAGKADLGNGITGTWTEYNMQGSITTATNSVTLPNSWGGPTAWITLDSAIDLAQNQMLTFDYTYTYTSTVDNAIYSISFLGNGGESAFMIGNTDYNIRDLAAASTTLGTEFYNNKAQSIRFNAGNSGDRFQPVRDGDTKINLGTVSYGAVNATIAWNAESSSFKMTLRTGDKSATLDLGDSVKFDTISFAADGNESQAITGISLNIIPEPSTFGLLAGLGALALVGTRRRRK